MAKKLIRPIRNEGEYDEALKEIERYFEEEPKQGTTEADRFDLLALIIEDYERKRSRGPGGCRGIAANGSPRLTHFGWIVLDAAAFAVQHNPG